MKVVYFVSGSMDYIDMLKLSASSVKHAMPDAEIHLFTDLDVELPGVITHKESYSNPLMVQNTMVWRDFCAEHEGPAIFLDPDVLMTNRDMPIYLADVAVTWRDNLGDFSRRMPYNTGVVFARCGAKSAVFFGDMVERVLAMSAEDKKWYGNQLALAEMLGNPPKDIVDGWKHARKVNWTPKDVNGVGVNFLPCERYNWTPEEDAPLMDRHFIHLKGNRKHRMQKLHDQLVAE